MIVYNSSVKQNSYREYILVVINKELEIRAAAQEPYLEQTLYKVRRR